MDRAAKDVKQDAVAATTIKLRRLTLEVDAARPALLFRLHDFPTVLLRPTEARSVASGQSLAFARGKSCLLEWPSGDRPAGAQKP